MVYLSQDVVNSNRLSLTIDEEHMGYKSQVVPPSGYIGINDYAEKVNLSRSHVDFLVHTGSLEYVKVGGKRFVKSDAPKPYAKRRTHAPVR